MVQLVSTRRPMPSRVLRAVGRGMLRFLAELARVLISFLGGVVVLAAAVVAVTAVASTPTVTARMDQAVELAGGPDEVTALLLIAAIQAILTVAVTTVLFGRGVFRAARGVRTAVVALAALRKPPPTSPPRHLSVSVNDNPTWRRAPHRDVA